MATSDLVRKRRRAVETLEGQYDRMKNFKSIALNTTASCLSEMPTTARAFFLLGLQREEQGDLAEALAEYEAAQRLSKKNAHLLDQKIIEIKTKIRAAA